MALRLVNCSKVWNYLGRLHNDLSEKENSRTYYLADYPHHAHKSMNLWQVTAVCAYLLPYIWNCVKSYDVYTSICHIEHVAYHVVEYHRICIVQIDLMRTNPAGWDSDRPVTLESYTDAVIYELHVRDFSSDKSANFRLRGKFGAFCENRVTNGFSDTVGLDYIASLGVTHIHLLPVFDSQTIDENDPEAGFNWGYDQLIN